tara:strand:+ start:162 stop:320 length:159 start_codon:yes stop_codon:yes gene_type:complete
MGKIRKTKVPKRRNRFAAAVTNPNGPFTEKVMRDRTKYRRKNKHVKKDDSEI